MQYIKVITNCKGITLIELLITISISAIIFTAVLSLFKEGLLSYDRSVNEAESLLDLQYIHDMTKRDIVDSVIGTYDGQLYPKINSDKNRLTLLIKNDDGNFTFVTYFFENGSKSLYRLDGNEDKVPASDDKPIIEDISFLVEIDENKLVKVTITKQLISSYSMQEINKEVVINGKPRVRISD